MTPAIGRALILIALLAASAGAVVAFATGRRYSTSGAQWARRLAYVFAIAVGLANALMVYALVTHDFRVGYVAQVGSLASPTWVSVVSLWSSLEGSILFWGLILGGYVAVATKMLQHRHPELLPDAMGVWLVAAAFFAFLLAGPAQPFVTIPNPQADGPGPNPLLQNHVLMMIHPPFLYLGYVGMTIPFGLACAALLRGRLGQDFVGALRTWLLLPWIFLTCAIVLGGWWAYEVLGWGGYWAWDPVENASFLPWLTATAALHSAILTERKGILKGWTTTLVLATFLLTILGTFMTRSGVFNSVHSFTQSAIGPTILVFFAFGLVFSVVLLAFRVDTLSADGALGDPMSREGAFLLNNLLFVLFTFTVLVGTVFPLLVEAARGVQMSVGRPYFDAMAVPIGAALLFLMGVGPALPWGAATGEQVRRALLPPLLGAVVLCAIGYALGVRNAWTLVTLAFGGYAAQVTLGEMWLPLRQRMRGRGEAFGQAFVHGQLRQGRRRFAAYVVHSGAAVVIIAIAVSSTMGVSREVRLRVGETARIGDYTLTFVKADDVTEPHRRSLVATVAVSRDGKDLGTLQPAMNEYAAQREPIGTPAVRTSLKEDLYLSVMNIDVEAGTLGLLAMVNPMVGCLWLATGVMALGGLMALVPSRRRAEVTAPGSATVGSGLAAEPTP